MRYGIGPGARICSLAIDGVVRPYESVHVLRRSPDTIHYPIINPKFEGWFYFNDVLQRRQIPWKARRSLFLDGCRSWSDVIHYTPKELLSLEGIGPTIVTRIHL